MKLEMITGRKLENTLKLNNIILNNQIFNEEVKREIKNYLGTNENGNITTETGDTLKAVLRGTFLPKIFKNATLKKRERFQIS